MLRRFIPTENAPLSVRGQAAARARRRVGMVIGGGLLLLAVAGTLGGCGVKAAPRVQLPATPVISVRPRWAVAITAYTRVRAQPTEDSAIRGHLRAGDVAEIVSIGATPALVDGRREYWHELSSDGLHGWVPGSDLRFYESRSRALNAARALTGAVVGGNPLRNEGGEP